MDRCDWSKSIKMIRKFGIYYERKTTLMMYYWHWESTLFSAKVNRIKKEYANFDDSPNFSFTEKWPTGDNQEH